MTFSDWWMQVQRLISGRAAVDSTSHSLTLPEIELPSIEPKPKFAEPVNNGEKERLEQRQRAHERELARLRVVARARFARDDT